MQNRQNARQRREKLHHLVSHFTFDWVLTKWVRFDLFWCHCNAPTCLVFYLWRWPTHTHDWGFFFISCPDSLLSDNDNFQEPAFSEWSEAKLPLFQASLRSPRLKQSQVCLHLKSSHQNTSCLIPMLNEHIEPTFTKLFLCVFFFFLSAGREPATNNNNASAVALNSSLTLWYQVFQSVPKH